MVRVPPLPGFSESHFIYPPRCSSDVNDCRKNLDFEIDFKTASVDLNNDGIVNDNDIIMLLFIIYEQNNNQFSGDINLDSRIDVFDLLLLSDHLYNQ